PIRRWSNGGRGPPRDVPVALPTGTRLQALADGRLAFAPDGGPVAILHPSVRLLWGRRAGAADFRDHTDTLAASQHDSTGEFSYDRFGNSPTRFALATKSLSVGDPSDTTLAAALTEAPELKVLDWNHSEHPTLNGAALPLRPHDEALSVAISPDHGSFVLGTT